MNTPTAPPRPFIACIIESPRHGERVYTEAQVADALADIAKAKAKRGALLVGVIGSREYDQRKHYDAIVDTVQKLCKLHNKAPADVVVVSGGARGVDRLAEAFAYNNQLPLITWPADWEGPLKLGAGYHRNTHIADSHLDELVAMPECDDEGEPTGGTADTIAKARQRLVPVTLLKG